MKRCLAMLTVFMLIISLFTGAVLAEGNSGNPGNSGNTGENDNNTGGEVVVDTPDPAQILTNPDFDLSTVDQGILAAWYASEVYVPDATLAKALLNASNSSVLTVEAMLSLPENLDLNNLGITNLTGIEYAINVKFLSVNNNSIVSLDPIKNLYNLEKLDYSYNNVRMVPAFLFSMRNLKSVNGCANSSTVVATPETTQSALAELFLEDNQLTTLPSLTGLTNLSVLSLARNSFAEFPQSVLSLPALTMLYLSENKLTFVPNLSALDKVVVLYLDNNYITDFPEGLENMTALEQLCLQKNSIKSIPDTLSSVRSLNTLILYANGITVLPESLIAAKQLKVLDVGLNEIDIEANSAVIKGLENQLNAFYYRMQNPHFTLTVSIDKDTGSPKLTWEGIEDINEPEEGYYNIVKFIIERKEETLEEYNKNNNAATTGATAGSSDGQEQADGVKTDDNADNVVNDSQDGVKPTISVYETINELSPDEREYIDTTADKDKKYTYRVTVYITGMYMDNYVIDTGGSETVNSEQAQLEGAAGRTLAMYIGIGVAVVAAVGGAIWVFLRNRGKIKKSSGVKEVKKRAAVPKDTKADNEPEQESPRADDSIASAEDYHRPENDKDEDVSANVSAQSANEAADRVSFHRSRFESLFDDEESDEKAIILKPKDGKDRK